MVLPYDTYGMVHTMESIVYPQCMLNIVPETKIGYIKI